VTKARPVVIVVDDDLSILRALRRLIAGAGFDVRTFDRPSVLLGSSLPTADACLVVDVYLPEMNGVELCSALAASGCRLPVILVTAHADETTRPGTERSPGRITHQTVRQRLASERD
jgi:FixJ family two-component response regulator